MWGLAEKRVAGVDLNSWERLTLITRTRIMMVVNLTLSVDERIVRKARSPLRRPPERRSQVLGPALHLLAP